MASRVSYSLLDPWLTHPIKGLYAKLRIPAAFPPEGIVVVGHLLAIAGAVGFALATKFWWAGLLAAVGVILNHTADVLDGTHARATGQCRNGGELLDHFVDPLSFSYWVAGIAYAAECVWLAVAAIIAIYATSVLTNIKAKMVGEFTLARFGPTEVKTLLTLFALLSAAITAGWISVGVSTVSIAFWFLLLLIIAGLVQLKLSLLQAIREVNSGGTAPDTTEWKNQ